MENKQPTPIARHDALRPLSREHHFGLLLCWKIRMGFQKGISPQRIKKYCDWFYSRYLVPHYEIEEKFLFPILGDDNDMVNKALSDHRKVGELIKEHENLEEVLRLLERTLNNHIRFEERVLFNEIERVATADQLELMEKMHPEELREEKYEDEFWEAGSC